MLQELFHGILCRGRHQPTGTYIPNAYDCILGFNISSLSR